MRRLLTRPVLLCLVLPCLLLNGCSGQVAPPSMPTRAEVRAAGILEGWDQRRALAWAHGSLAELRALYVAGSATGAADVRMLRAWRARGLVVADLTTQLLAVDVLARTPDRLRLRVTDRVLRAEAADRMGRRLGLPRDQPSTYVIVMVRYDDVWLVSETTAV